MVVGSDPDFVHKVVFLGDSGVGKTSLVQRYVYDSLAPDISRTIGAMLHVKSVELEGAKHKLVIWDLGGQVAFSALREQYCSHASGAFFVFDRTRIETLEHIDDWLDSLYAAAGKVAVVAVENKIFTQDRDYCTGIWFYWRQIMAELPDHLFPLFLANHRDGWHRDFFRDAIV